jgi:hypothetical protein
MPKPADPCLNPRIYASRNGITLKTGRGRNSKFRFFSRIELAKMLSFVEKLNAAGDRKEVEIDDMGREIQETTDV